MSVVKDFDPDTVNAGESGSFTITVTNDGTADAEDVLIEDTVDSRLTVTGVTAVGDPADDGAETNPDTDPQTIDWLIPSLDVGESVTLTVALDVDSDVDSDSAVLNTADVSDEDATLSDGSFEIVGLPMGNYSLTETQPGNFDDGDDTAGTAGGKVSVTFGKDRISGIQRAAGEEAADYLFGELGGATGSLFGHRLQRLGQ